MCKTGRLKTFVEDVDLIEQGRPFRHPDIFGKNAAKTRDGAA